MALPGAGPRKRRTDRLSLGEQRDAKVRTSLSAPTFGGVIKIIAAALLAIALFLQLEDRIRLTFPVNERLIHVLDSYGDTSASDEKNTWDSKELLEMVAKAKVQVADAERRHRSTVRLPRQLAEIPALSFVQEYMENNLINVRSIIPYFLYCVSAVLIWAGHTLCRRPMLTELRLQRLPSRYSLFLRPFAADNRGTFEIKGGFLASALGAGQAYQSQGILSKLQNLNPLQLMRMLFCPPLDTAETQLAHGIRKRGPLLAIGRPGERIAPAGAQRMYSDDGEWTQHVLDLIARADRIYIQPSDTSGLQWELQQVCGMRPLKDVILVLAGLRDNRWAWEDVRPSLTAMLGVELPENIQGAVALSFSHERVVRVHMPAYHHPFLWPLKGLAVDMERTLDADCSSRVKPSDTLGWTIAWYLILAMMYNLAGSLVLALLS